MEAPRGVQINAAAGDLKATCRKELHLQSTEGEVSSAGRMFYCPVQLKTNNARIIYSTVWWTYKKHSALAYIKIFFIIIVIYYYLFFIFQTFELLNLMHTEKSEMDIEKNSF